jgi:hypothetical protein
LGNSIDIDEYSLRAESSVLSKISEELLIHFNQRSKINCHSRYLSDGCSEECPFYERVEGRRLVSANAARKQDPLQGRSLKLVQKDIADVPVEIDRK